MTIETQKPTDFSETMTIDQMVEYASNNRQDGIQEIERHLEHCNVYNGCMLGTESKNWGTVIARIHTATETIFGVPICVVCKTDLTAPEDGVAYRVDVRAELPGPTGAGVKRLSNNLFRVPVCDRCLEKMAQNTGASMNVGQNTLCDARRTSYLDDILGTFGG